MTTPLDSLQRERIGYVMRGLKDRVAQVDAQIRKLGGKADPGMSVDEIREAESPVVEAAAKLPARKR